MKVLKYSNRKEEPSYWDASTPEKEAAAYKCLFIHLKDDWHCYDHLRGGDTELKEREQELLELNKLQEQLLSIPEMLRKDAEAKLEQIPKLKRYISLLKAQQMQWDRIMAGEDKAIRTLLRSRQSYEYEEWEIIEIDDPFEYLAKRNKQQLEEGYS